jgi:hypothetical protein
MTKYWIIAFLVFGHMVQAGHPDEVLSRLARVEQFAFGGVGYAGVTSQGEKDYRVVLSHSSALADFEKLYSAGNLQAKSYALVGIRKLNSDRFKELSQSLRDSKDEVTTLHGCIVSHEPLGALVRQIEGGKYSSE